MTVSEVAIYASSAVALALSLWAFISESRRYKKPLGIALAVLAFGGALWKDTSGIRQSEAEFNLLTAQARSNLRGVDSVIRAANLSLSQQDSIMLATNLSLRQQDTSMERMLELKQQENALNETQKKSFTQLRAMQLPMGSPICIVSAIFNLKDTNFHALLDEMLKHPNSMEVPNPDSVANREAAKELRFILDTFFALVTVWKHCDSVYSPSFVLAPIHNSGFPQDPADVFYYPNRCSIQRTLRLQYIPGGPDDGCLDYLDGWNGALVGLTFSKGALPSESDAWISAGPYNNRSFPFFFARPFRTDTISTYLLHLAGIALPDDD